MNQIRFILLLQNLLEWYHQIQVEPRGGGDKIVWTLQYEKGKNSVNITVWKKDTKLIKEKTKNKKVKQKSK
jgi:hypothetical protein